MRKILQIDNEGDMKRSKKWGIYLSFVEKVMNIRKMKYVDKMGRTKNKNKKRGTNPVGNSAPEHHRDIIYISKIKRGV